jgi:hypothetical protein
VTSNFALFLVSVAGISLSGVMIPGPLTAATIAYKQAGIELIVQIEQIRAALTGPDGLFSNTIRDLTFQTLTPQGQYDFIQDQIRILEGQLATATDPTRINSIATQLDQYYRQGFGMLSPEQQISKLPEYIASLTALQTTVNERLDAARSEIEGALTGLVTTISEKLDTVVGEMQKSATVQTEAANAQVVAANTQITAANTPVQVNVRLDGAFAANVNGG